MPRGMDEGATVAVREPEFEVLANQPVSFQLYTSTSRSGEAAGALFTRHRARARHPAAHPHRAAPRAEARRPHDSRPRRGDADRARHARALVRGQGKRASLAARVPAPRRAAPDRRGGGRGAERRRAEREPGAARGGDRRRSPRCSRRRRRSPRRGRSARALPRALETALGAGKDGWPLGVLRALWDALWAGAAAPDADGRARGALAEPLRLPAPSRLRPRDGRVARATARAVRSPPGWPSRARCRTAPSGGTSGSASPEGSSAASSCACTARSAPWIVPRIAKKAKVKVSGSARPGTQEIREMWQAIGACERLDARSKRELGDVVVDGPRARQGRAATDLGAGASRRRASRSTVR